MRLPVLPVRAALTSDTPQTPTAAAATIWSVRLTPAKSIAFSVRSSVPSSAIPRFPPTALTPVRRDRRSKNVRRTSKNIIVTARPAITDIISSQTCQPAVTKYAAIKGRLQAIPAAIKEKTIQITNNTLMTTSDV